VSSPAEVSLIRFGVFELDLCQQQLRRGGVLIKLSPQQFRVLRLLAEHSGQVCTREEIQREVWGSEVFVDFDRGLNVCIAAIRAALNDDSEAPRFIQTVPRQGYRFVAPVEQVPGSAPIPAAPLSQATGLRVAVVVAGIAAVVTAAIFLIPRHTKRLAVLPFENLTGETGDGPVAAGLTDELTTQLGAADPGRLAVIGRTSAARFAAGKAAMADLSVDYVIEGSLRSESGHMRVSVRLLDARGQAQIWNHTYQSSGSGRLEWQDTVASGVTRAVTSKLFAHEARLPPPYQADPQAAEAYWNGRYLDRRDTLRSIQWFEDAARRDARFAAPRVALAETWLAQALTGSDPAASFAKARAAAQEAIKVEEWNAEAHATLGAICFWNDWNRREARRQFERALELNPSLARAHHDYGFLLVETGDAEAGIKELRIGIALDPVSPRVNIDAGWIFLQARRFDDAVRYAKRALELEPRLGEARLCISRAEIYQGQAKPEDLEKLRTSANPYYRAMAAAIRGAKSEALAALDEAMAAHNVMLAMIGTEPAFDSLRRDPHFRELQRKIGIKG
jgi:DNA-binding winged helix-turn-helix (wHTH) protein/TolB-like protein/Tfp pilus assembly protein PilF